jgi:hypothetical protein
MTCDAHAWIVHSALSGSCFRAGVDVEWVRPPGLHDNVGESGRRRAPNPERPSGRIGVGYDGADTARDAVLDRLLIGLESIGYPGRARMNGIATEKLGLRVGVLICKGGLGVQALVISVANEEGYIQDALSFHRYVRHVRERQRDFECSTVGLLDSRLYAHRYGGPGVSVGARLDVSELCVCL